jgi:hypothetical protein
LLLFLFAGWTGCTGETGLSDGTETSDEVEPGYLEWARADVGVTGDGDAMSGDDELWV